MDKYATVQLYLDNDVAGRKRSSYALDLYPRFQDCSGLYRNYKNLNDWLIDPNNWEKSPRRPKPFLRAETSNKSPTTYSERCIRGAINR